MGKLFGTDGVRGKANVDLTPELACQLGKAVAHVLVGEETPAIAIGKDTRISGDMLESALIAGILSRGVDVYRLGVIPTPAIAYLTKHLKADAGAVISASHNAFEDNGIKFFNRFGFKLSDEIEEQVEALVLEGKELPQATGSDIGRIIDFENAKEVYSQYMIKQFSGSLSGLKVVLDCANGAASEVSPHVLKELGADLIVINNQPDGININANCGSTHLDFLKEEVIKHQADIGIAHDGDADRMLAVDETGDEVDGDKILVICAKHLKEKGLLKNNKVVVTVMSNIGLMKAFEEAEIEVEVTGVGDRYVLERMVDKEASLGGEQSGHIIFLDTNTTGDGLMSALKLMEVMVSKKKPLSELATQMQSYPQVLVNAVVKNKQEAMENPEFIQEIKRMEKKLGDQGRILVRPSGTEPKIRIMVEGQDLEELDFMARELKKIIIQ
ncbi:phosphoglucosamine mutase [Clostridia bacterium]|nr:phosphoglucosamine mutase [Clostridia bacterium]